VPEFDGAVERLVELLQRRNSGPSAVSEDDAALTQLLHRMSGILEVEEQRYERECSDPTVDQRDSFPIGRLLGLLHEQQNLEHFADTLIDCAVSVALGTPEETTALAATRFLVASAPWLASLRDEMRPDSLLEDRTLHRLIDWIKTAEVPKSSHASGLLGVALLDRDVADTVVRWGLAPVLLKRLRLLTTDAPNLLAAETQRLVGTDDPNAADPETGLPIRELLSREQRHTIGCLAALGDYQEVRCSLSQHGSRAGGRRRCLRAFAYAA
jgi:hypothetical protein